MTEQEWLDGTDPQPMLELLRGKASDRKLRLFGCACCRRLWEFLTEESSRTTVEVAEQFADGLLGRLESTTAHHAANTAHKEGRSAEGDTWRIFALRAAAFTAASNNFAVDAIALKIARDAAHAGLPGSRLCEKEGQCQLLRDIVGNPFRPVAFDPVWRTPSVTAVAQAIYTERRFADLTNLADALEKAGCTNTDILDHCRSGGEHVLGCWVVDLVLEKN